MGKMNAGLAAYLAKKKNGAMLPSPQASASTHPMVPMSPSMMVSIKQSAKGQIPPGLAKYLAAKKGVKKQ